MYQQLTLIQILFSQSGPKLIQTPRKFTKHRSKDIYKNHLCNLSNKNMRRSHMIKQPGFDVQRHS